jgi:glycerophosphoryl diester phosphodiesterase
MEEKKIDLDILHTMCTKELVDACHERGIKVNIWTLNDRTKLEEYIEMGVDYITSDFISPKTK